MGEALPGFIEASAANLAFEWRQLPSQFSAKDVPVQIASAIERSVNCKTKTYRYVLPTQLLAKITDPDLDCRSIQMQSNLKNPFDARSLCHAVVVPFDQENNNVLGGSVEPYINNPIRIPAIVPEALAAQRDKAGFQDLIDVLAYTQKNPHQTRDLFRLTLAAIRSRLGTVRIVYPAPNRLSLKQAILLIQSFLNDRTGGLRMQAVAIALFRTIGDVFKLFSTVRSAKINAADASTGNIADLDCMDGQGDVILVVEVKDRELRLHDLQAKLPTIREQGIGEVLFLTQGSVANVDRETVNETIDRQFPSGHNIYVAEFGNLLESCLILFGQHGRRAFISNVGTALDEHGADISHRRRWAELLANV